MKALLIYGLLVSFYVDKVLCLEGLFDIKGLSIFNFIIYLLLVLYAVEVSIERRKISPQ